MLGVKIRKIYFLFIVFVTVFSIVPHVLAAVSVGYIQVMDLPSDKIVAPGAHLEIKVQISIISPPGGSTAYTKLWIIGPNSYECQLSWKEFTVPVCSSCGKQIYFDYTLPSDAPEGWYDLYADTWWSCSGQQADGSCIDEGSSFSCSDNTVGWTRDLENAFQVKICKSHDHCDCYSNDVYWYDSCNNKEEKKEECGSDSCSEWGNNYCKDHSLYRSRTCHERGCSGCSCYDNTYPDEEEVDDCTDCSCSCGDYGKSSESGYCSDGKDNDCDGFTDSADLDCETCTDECSSGQTRCNGNYAQTCGNYDADPCLEWGGNTDCGKSNYCSSGSCLSCALGRGNCNEDSSDICETYLLTDKNNCGSCGNICGSDKSCVEGQCISKDEELLRKYSPILYLNQHNYKSTPWWESRFFYPTSIYSMLNNSDLKLAKPPYPPESIDLAPVSIESLQDKTDKYYLDLKQSGCLIQETDPYCPVSPYVEFLLTKINQPSDISKLNSYGGKVYGRVFRDESYPNKIVLQYWFFYYFDAKSDDFHLSTLKSATNALINYYSSHVGGTVLGIFEDSYVSNHEGDWELVQIILDKSSGKYKPESMTFAYHGLHENYNWNHVNKYPNIPQQTHPKVYVAAYSHASYKDPYPIGEIFPKIVDGQTIPSDNNYYRIFAIDYLRDSIQEKEAGRPPMEYDLEIIDETTPWVSFEGTWGQQSYIYLSEYFLIFFKERSGPKSPGNPERLEWTDPIKWAETPNLPILQIATGSPVNLHAYDSEGNHVGLNESGVYEFEIPGLLTAGLSQNSSLPEIMLFYNISNITFFIEAYDSGSMNFTLEKMENITKKFSYDNLVIQLNTKIKVNMSDQGNYTLQIDYEGDNQTDAQIDPALTILEDIDKDGVLELHDNCPNTYNPNQTDADNNGLGDVCDALSMECDANQDYVINIYDLAAVDMALGSNKFGENYNPNADMNQDGIINILDLAAVGLRYGNSLDICTRDDLCSEWDYCDLKTLDMGECKPLPNQCVCIAFYDPVCGTDDKIYSNDCVINCLGVSKACDGKCPCKPTEVCITETFDTTSYMDAATTADWDTSEGKLKIVYADSPLGSATDDAHIVGTQPSGLEFYQANSFMLPDDFTLKSVSFRIHSFINNNIPSGLWIQIRADDGNGFPGNTVLREALNHYTTAGWKTVSFSPLLLDKNTRYHLVLITDNQKSGGNEPVAHGYWWNDRHGSPFELGYQESYKYNGDYWYKIVGDNFVFYLDGDYKGEGISIKLNPGGAVATATLNVSDQKPADSSISYYLSTDGGIHWEQVLPGTEHTFTNIGDDLRWKAILETGDISEKPEIDSLTICYG